MSIAERRLVVEITDNGGGFNPSDVSAGNGLANMRKRTQVAGALLELTSEAGKGTRIAARFPLSD